MYVDFSELFHQSSKDRSGEGRVKIPLDPAAWPKEWTEIEYKAYPRFPKVPLAGEDPSGDLWDAIRGRASQRDFTARPLPLRDISLLLKYSCGTFAGTRRAQPSGGGRYPIEAYPLIFVGSDGIPSGVYHYNVREHALDSLWERAFTESDAAELFTYPWAQQASLALVLTAVFRRNQAKYGERGYRQILIEAGAIVQNVYLVSQRLGIKCCAIDGVVEPAIEKLIDVDGVSESVLTSIVLG
ncbi:MAG: hypothetical protein RLZZ416_803 [Candidatus Parcubacteria bacterium]|jgi:SagB-type dehydrogenase family enzyme